MSSSQDDHPQAYLQEIAASGDPFVTDYRFLCFLTHAATAMHTFSLARACVMAWT
jgi:hypothetical protein